MAFFHTETDSQLTNCTIDAIYVAKLRQDPSRLPSCSQRPPPPATNTFNERVRIPSLSRPCFPVPSETRDMMLRYSY